MLEKGSTKQINKTKNIHTHTMTKVCQRDVGADMRANVSGSQ